MKKMKRSKLEISEVMEKIFYSQDYRRINLEGGNFLLILLPQALFVFNPESKIFFSITSEISNLDLFIFFISCQNTKVAIILYFRAYFLINEIHKKTTHVFIKT